MIGKGPISVTSEDPIPLESLGLSIRAYNALKRRGYRHLDQVGLLGYDNLLATHRVGVKTAEEIWRKLISYLELHAIPYSISTTVSSDFEETALPRGKETPIEELGLSPSVCRKLRRHGYRSVELVARLGYSGIKNLPGMREGQAREIWLAMFAYWKTLDEKFPIKPTLTAPNLDLASIQVGALLLSARARNALHRANVLTIGDLCFLGRESTEMIRGVGETASQEIWRTLELYLLNPAVSDYRPFEPTLVSEMTETTVPDMTESDYTPTGIPSLPNLLPVLCRQISVRGAKDYRGYEVLKRRFGLEDNKIYTLNEIGLFYDGISRERVRQIEQRAISRLQRCLMQGIFRRLPFKVHEDIASEVKSLYESLTTTAEAVETETQLFEIISERYGLEEIDGKKQASMRLLFRVYGFSKLSTSYPRVANISVHPAWVVRRGEVKLGQLRTAIQLIFNILRDNVIPMSYFDLKVRVNKRRRKNPINDPTMRVALHLCADVEALDEAHYQIRFERLRGCGTLAYRVLWVAGSPLSFKEVYKEINRRLVFAGESPADRRTLRSAMSQDIHLASDGKRWGVAERDNLVQATIVDIMLEYFHKTGQPATPKQLFQYVLQYKKTRRESIYHFLTTRQDRFVRVGPSLYQPVAWGYVKKYESERDERTARWSPEKVAELIEDIFRERRVESMPFSELVAAAAERMGKPRKQSYASVRKSPAIRVQPLSKGSRRLLALFVSEFRDSIAKRQKAKTKRERLWEAAEELLRQTPSRSLPQRKLMRELRTTIGISQSTFYRYIAEMPNIVRSPTAEQGVICTLSAERTLDTSPELAHRRYTGENELRIHILHLSDIHLGTRSQAHKYRTQLETDLRQELKTSRLEYLVISGDVADYSTPEEYEAAFELIDSLVKRFGLDASRAVVVPGNHDLNWDLSKQAYPFVFRDDLPDPLPEGLYIPAGDAGALLRDEDLYQERFAHFSTHFHKKVYGGTPYPQDYAEQGRLYLRPDDRILFLGLNSCWQIDHHYCQRAGIHMGALSCALDQLTDGDYDDWLKIAVWHHPVTGPEMMNDEFLQLLAVHGFQICMHGHIHEARQGFYTYDPARGLHIVGAGTFGAPTREQVPGIPLQYNLLILDPETRTVTVETRKKEKPDGAWSADARWGDKNNPVPRYTIELK